MRAEDLVTSGKLDADALSRLPTTTKGLLYLATVWAPRGHTVVEEENVLGHLWHWEVQGMYRGPWRSPRLAVVRVCPHF